MSVDQFFLKGQGLCDQQYCGKLEQHCIGLHQSFKAGKKPLVCTCIIIIGKRMVSHGAQTCNFVSVD